MLHPTRTTYPSAIDRTQLANERTLLAYLRTALMLVVAGASAIKFFGDTRALVVSGWVLIGLGVVTGLVGLRRWSKMQLRISRRRRE